VPTTTTSQSSYLSTVSREDAKRHLRIFANDFDVEVEATIKSAVDWCENYTGRTLREAVARIASLGSWCLPRDLFVHQPVIAVQSVTYFDESDAQQTVSDSDYRLIRSDEASSFVELASGFSRPNLSARSDAVQVAYTSGYSQIKDIPDRAKQAIKMMLSVYWGDLSPREVEAWERQARMILGSLDWGIYR